MSAIRVEGLSKRFNETTALDAVSLDFPAGSFTALLGPSGCAKTTMLRLIAGFEAPSEGRVPAVAVFRERISARPGETLYVEPDTAKLNLFDAESGRELAS
jgi:iron(III) transport system ATP-binding protein